MYTYDYYLKNAQIIRRYIGNFEPEVLMVLGSGLGFIAEHIENPVTVDYKLNSKIHQTFAPGHKARFVFGELEGKKVCAMQGRIHCYEGYTAEDVSFPVRMLKILGADKLILTNAAGCINTSWQKGDIMAISDHIRLMGQSPLTGENIPEFGDRFPDMGEVYCEEYRKIAAEEAEKLGITLRSGVYMYFLGPQFETPAEIRAARILGADAAGMSTVPEATAARHCGMKILGLSLMTNMAAGINKGENLNGEDVVGVSFDRGEDFSALVEACLKRM